jgi:TPR repeat protein
MLLWEMTKPESFYNNLRREAAAQNPEALFVWYGLFSLQFDNRITERDAVNLLENSAAQYYLPAITELGLNYYTGKFIKENKQKALDIWNAAENLGSMEARIRLAAAEIFGFVKGSGIDAAIKILNEGEKQGSILAQVTLAYCYENGIGVGKNKAEAVKQYRNAAQRGSRYGYAELQRIYNEIRPSDSEFSVN